MSAVTAMPARALLRRSISASTAARSAVVPAHAGSKCAQFPTSSTATSASGLEQLRNFSSAAHSTPENEALSAAVLNPSGAASQDGALQRDVLRKIGDAGRSGTLRIGWVGLGKMGKGMAGNLWRRGIAQRLHASGQSSGPDRFAATPGGILQKGWSVRGFDVFPAAQKAWAEEHSTDAAHLERQGLAGEAVESLSWEAERAEAISCTSLPQLFRECHIVMCCVPTSVQVKSVAEELMRCKKEDGANVATRLFVDCSSGDYDRTCEIEEILSTGADCGGDDPSVNNVLMADCPVSGGPGGASSGLLSCMVGLDSNEVFDEVLGPILCNSFAANRRLPQASNDPLATSQFEKDITALLYPDNGRFHPSNYNVFHVGRVGAGHATKSVNNVLNAGNLLYALEGLAALRMGTGNGGVAPEPALKVINKSSGRSLQSVVRIPNEVLTRKFGYGFAYELMLKDVVQAARLVEKHAVDRSPDGSTSASSSGGLLTAAIRESMLEGADFLGVDRSVAYSTADDGKKDDASKDSKEPRPVPPHVDSTEIARWVEWASGSGEMRVERAGDESGTAGGSGGGVSGFSAAGGAKKTASAAA